MRMYTVRRWNYEKECADYVDMSVEEIIRTEHSIYGLDIAYVLLNEARISRGLPELWGDAKTIFGETEQT